MKKTTYIERGTSLAADVWQTSDKPFSDYPVGTKAQALGGGYWIKNERGWKWCTGATFPTPGGMGWLVCQQKLSSRVF